MSWYTRSLGGALLARLPARPGPDLASIVADSIDEVTDRHRHTCDVAHPGSPHATVLVVRRRHAELQFLMLGDSFLVLERRGGEPDVRTDGREVAVRHACSALLDDLVTGTPEHARARESAVATMRSRRNRPGGYWIAKDDPKAAAHAVTDCVPVDGYTGAALLTNGASRLVAPYRALGWPEMFDLVRSQGPAHVLDRLRRVEAARRTEWRSEENVSPDDATIVYWALSEDR